MASWEDVRRIALALPETEERPSRRGQAFWFVKGKSFVWERPLRGTDLKALGETAPEGPILGARVEHLMAREALLADGPAGVFTIPHFEGYPAVLVALDQVKPDDLNEIIIEAWLVRAPKRLAEEFVRTTLHGPGDQAD